MAPAYFLDNQPGPETLPHKGSPVSPETLKSLSIIITPISEQGPNLEARLKAIAKERGYPADVRIDRFTSKPGSEGDQKAWATERFHLDEVMWFTLRGGNFFDFRDLNENWIRVPIEANTLYITPGGLFHRYVTVDPQNASALLLCKGRSDFVHRKGQESDNHPVRLNFLQGIRR
ncbi:1,2-dihydroxy-3-keto-5-methylthiopentene dioxygenase [Marasmius crinis-equi]|uniref:acireductone dioxygenase (Fe(2+)-requiring) n=1 Tax=Marasmius crinis-equi TaxID=585013 RepID=A0ABR3FDZ5_9AGAR